MSQHQVLVVTDLGFGDSGKGSLTDTLVRRHEAGLVVRYNGGAQAAHTVVAPDGKTHTFHSFGSGTFVPGTESFLSRDVLLFPLALLAEADDLAAQGIPDALARLYVDENALVTTPYQMYANRLWEWARGEARHGSCGLGIGETMADALAHPESILRVQDLRDRAKVRATMRQHRDRKRRELADVLARVDHSDAPPAIATARERLDSEAEIRDAVGLYADLGESLNIVGAGFLARRLARSGCTVFEGAQGVLLDQDWGFHPYTTWSTTTPENALTLLEEAGYRDETTVLGVLRAYHTRHGAGPFPTENAELTRNLADRHNPHNTWQGAFRVGWFDLPLARYAIQVSKRIDALAITCLDRLAECSEWRIATNYALDGVPYTLVPGKRKRLEQREQIGHDLAHVAVSYRPAEPNPERYAEKIAQSLALPLAITSWGETADDKRFHATLP